MSNHVSLLPKIINCCPCAHGIKSEILTLASSPLNSFVPATLPDLLSSNCIWHPVSFLCLFPSNGQLIWSFHRWNVVFFFLSLSHCLILTSVSLNAICSETFFLVSYVWSSSCIVQYTPWHTVFLPSIYHSCNKVVMWLVNVPSIMYVSFMRAILVIKIGMKWKENFFYSVKGNPQ